MEARGSIVVKALCYKPEGRAFDTRWRELQQSGNKEWGAVSQYQEVSILYLKQLSGFFIFGEGHCSYQNAIKVD
jgi:hypothetical protein